MILLDGGNQKLKGITFEIVQKNSIKCCHLSVLSEHFCRFRSQEQRYPEMEQLPKPEPLRINEAG